MGGEKGKEEGKGMKSNYRKKLILGAFKNLHSFCFYRLFFSLR